MTPTWHRLTSLSFALVLFSGAAPAFAQQPIPGPGSAAVPPPSGSAPAPESAPAPAPAPAPESAPAPAPESAPESAPAPAPGSAPAPAPGSAPAPAPAPVPAPGQFAPPPSGYPPPPWGYPPPPPGWAPPPGVAPSAYSAYVRDPDEKTDEHGKPKRTWYGWQTLIVVGASLAIMPAAAGADAPEVAILGAGGLALGGPIVHWAHGNVGKGFGALGLNAGLPMAGSLVGLAAGSGGGNYSALAGAGVGFLIGGGTAIVIDIAALAYDDPESETEEARSPRPRALVAIPQVGVTREGATVGFAGAF